MSALPLPAPADNTPPNAALTPRRTRRPSARARADLRWTLEPDLDFALLEGPSLEPATRRQHRERGVAFVTGDPITVDATRGGARRVVLRVLVTLVAVATAFFLFFPAGVEADSAPRATTTYVVQPGDTLWSLAAARTPAGSDLRATIDDIKSLNEMTESMLLVGDQIILPAPTR